MCDDLSFYFANERSRLATTAIGQNILGKSYRLFNEEFIILSAVRILGAEDEKNILLMYSIFLEGEGY